MIRKYQVIYKVFLINIYNYTKLIKGMVLIACHSEKYKKFNYLVRFEHFPQFTTLVQFLDSVRVLKQHFINFYFIKNFFIYFT